MFVLVLMTGQMRTPGGRREEIPYIKGGHCNAAGQGGKPLSRQLLRFWLQNFLIILANDS
ncbi:hypothetical protein APT61_07555 [Leclercia adecarboxylata]|nr:hypothetical protein APT61_07555 [Leclercia adecarboxylata]OOB88289.1 hypothetical protein BZY71_04760 [Leclercia adecarboxylata]